MMYSQLERISSYQDSLKVLEADIQHANSLAAAIPRTKGGGQLHMRLVYNNWAPIFLFLLRWIDCSCACFMPRYLNLFHILIYKVYSDGRQSIRSNARKASVKDFYAVILPSLLRLHDSYEESEDIYGMKLSLAIKLTAQWKAKRDKRFAYELEREDECGICLEPCTKIVLPNCCHSMCIRCYRDWNMKSESCPFCRGSLKRVKSEDLWVLPCEDEVVDPETVTKEDLLRFYLYVNSLPKECPDALFLIYYDYLM
ncbi:hypothetical protein SAY86_002790 [Trapa natans]|uniref:RING-type domain-containing protein n=1 Tax=Trapa natans TaxID=22666 RepID=A0AAN7LGK9_TRANT|nr:hypothetical protein SAY86_002790 [Trapa natans]